MTSYMHQPRTEPSYNEKNAKQTQPACPACLLLLCGRYLQKKVLQFERDFVFHVVLSYKLQVKQKPKKTKQTHNTQTKNNITNINNSASMMKHQKHAAACWFMWIMFQLHYHNSGYIGRVCYFTKMAQLHWKYHRTLKKNMHMAHCDVN